MAFSVRGKTAIVTGAGSGRRSPLHSLISCLSETLGINLCFANLLLSRGCNVLFADVALRKEAEESIQKHADLKAGSGIGKAAFQKTDVAEWKQLENMFAAAESQFGGTGADIVCPGAGVYEPVRVSILRLHISNPSMADMVKFLVSSW
jgi:3-hydroxybutyrate dehydrogenase